MFCDLKLTIDGLVGRLCAAEDRLEETIDKVVDKTRRMLLAEDEWLEKHKHRFHPVHKPAMGGSSGGGSSKGKAAARPDGGSSRQLN
jgi:hypothetical protein